LGRQSQQIYDIYDIYTYDLDLNVNWKEVAEYFIAIAKKEFEGA
jgi:hypothetical protein